MVESDHHRINRVDSTPADARCARAYSSGCSSQASILFHLCNAMLRLPDPGTPRAFCSFTILGLRARVIEYLICFLVFVAVVHGLRQITLK
jgi:hypothetical protein